MTQSAFASAVRFAVAAMLLALLGTVAHPEIALAQTVGCNANFPKTDWQWVAVFDTRDPRGTLHRVYSASNPVWAPDGHALAVDDVLPDPNCADAAASAVSVIEADGHRVVLGPGAGAAWAPDGQKVAYSSDIGPPRVYIASRSGVRLATIPHASHPSWSPDGSQIAFEQHLGRTHAIAVARADGTEARQVALGSWPAWSPLGDTIAFVGHDQGQRRVLVANVDGTNVHSFSATSGATWAVWSPDGTRLAVETERDLQSAELVVSVADSHVVLNLRSLGQNPAWSPDSHQLMLVDNVTDSIDIIHIDGVGFDQLPANATHIENATWSPDGARIAFDAVFDPLPPLRHL
jgi:dipeptidyl aminopeptidase/acylaminoacyl peptidase